MTDSPASRKNPPLPRRRSALRVLPESGPYFVVVTNRVNSGVRTLDETEKDCLLGLFRKWGAFSGIAMLTHCILDDHFHLLLWVPNRAPLTHAQIVERLRLVWEEDRREKWMESYKQASPPLRARMDDAVAGRTCNLAEFMRVCQQEFSQAYNTRHQNLGTVWASRFRSVVLEPSPIALLSAAAYIDLNPIRSGLCEDPCDYPWSGFGEASAQKSAAREGLMDLVAAAKGRMPGCSVSVSGERARTEESPPLPPSWEEIKAAYRLWLYPPEPLPGKQKLPERSRHQWKTLTPAEQLCEFEVHGEVPMAAALRKRCRAFTRGIAIGGEDFLGELLRANPDSFSPNRKKAAKDMKREWAGLCSMRQVD